MNTEDRRVKKTKKALQNALAELMNEKELRQITVQELVDLADIHRATFYLHYQDVYDLYEKIETQIITGFSSMLCSMPSHDYTSIYKSIVDNLAENKSLGKMVFGKHISSTFRARLTAVIEARYLEIWLFEENCTEITEDMRFFTAYHVGGCISLIERWVQNGYKENSAEIYYLLRSVNEGFDKLSVCNK